MKHLVLQAIALTLAILTPLVTVPASAQYYQNDFPPEEFRARWNQIFDAIGDKAVALVQGGASTRGFDFPRQVNEFYYLSGVETGHAYLLFDGRNRKVTLFLPARNEQLERAEGRVLSAADVDFAKKRIGVDEVRSTAEMGVGWIEKAVGNGQVIYTPFSPAEGYGQSRDEIEHANANIANDFWDGRISREQQFAGLLRARRPRSEIRNLTPILDEMRTIKSPREIALLRRSGKLAGLGMMEAMRSTQDGVYEYQLDAAARYVFLVNGSRLDAYRSIIASGTANINNMHYYRNNRQMKNGELVLMDYAPDVGYYTGDIGRVWPVSGKYTPVQRELLSGVLQYRNELLKRIRPGVTPAQIIKEAQGAMENYLRTKKFSKPIYEKAMREMVETGSGAFTHMVGLAVHDVGTYVDKPLRVGIVFSVDPTLRVPSEDLYLRYEDTVAVTPTGVDNFTDFLPSELDDMEAMTRQAGHRPDAAGASLSHLRAANQGAPDA